MPNISVTSRIAVVQTMAVLCATPLSAGFLYNGASPATPPWPGGVIPFVIDPALSPAQRKTFLDGIREWQLAANISFIPRTAETAYVFLKYNPSGPNRVSGNHPQIVEVNALTRSQICHEMGHSLGLDHEHIRPDRDSYVTVLSSNISGGNQFWFDIQANGISNGSYDFESVMHFGRDLFSINPGSLDTLVPKPGYERFQVRMGNFALSPGDRAALSWLYGSVTLSPVVTTTADTGPGSLRAALYHASDHPGTTITFNIPTTDPGYSGGVFTLKPTGHLPPLVTNGTTVDAGSQPGYAGNPLVFVDGSDILSESGDPPGLMVYAANCVIKGLAFTRARWVGVAILHPDATGNSVCSCWSGVAPPGNTAHANPKQGIQISDGAHGNTIGPDNVLSGNAEYGIWISGPDTSENIVSGNRIGTNADGTAALANGLGGVIVTDGAHDNVIGQGNVISGNANAGIWLTGNGVVNNVVDGNLIGTNSAGNAAVPNSFVGLYVVAGAADNVISSNVVAGNGGGFGYGMVLADPGSDDNLIQGNLIGTLRNGAALGNAFAGIAMWNGSQDNLVFENLIANNGDIGIALYDIPTVGHTFRANSIFNHGFAGIEIGTSNQSQTAPMLSTATAGSTGLSVTGSLASSPNSVFRIEFFSNPASGAGSGKNFIGAIEGVTTDGGGNASFNATVDAAVLAGRGITATATSTATGQTSRFSGPATVTTTDTDEDGMPDDYETVNGLNHAVDDADLDRDGDGASNLSEYLAGTNPRNAADLLKAHSVSRAGNQLTITFRVSPGRSYQLQESATLAADSWRIVTPVKNAASSQMVFSLPLQAGSSCGFHRLLLLE